MYSRAGIITPLDCHYTLSHDAKSAFQHVKEWTIRIYPQLFPSAAFIHSLDQTNLHPELIVGEACVVVDVQRLEDDLEVVLEVARVGDDRLAVRVRVPRLLVHLHAAGADQGLQQSSGMNRRVKLIENFSKYRVTRQLQVDDLLLLTSKQKLRTSQCSLLVLNATFNLM